LSFRSSRSHLRLRDCHYSHSNRREMLVVIDLQEYYLPEFQEDQERFDKLIGKLSARIRQAKEEEEIIVNLTCFEDGCTLPQVLEMGEGYKHRHFLAKCDFDGSSSLHGFISRKELLPEKIELCGAFMDVCVLDTWKGLRKLGYDVAPVDESLTICTPSNWREIKGYPKGYLRKE